ncbi:hypothetical protein B0H16DRAFT_1468069 [Mycena metata]|uniref:Ankyrin repeat protein n=1 Tax=Mycena metata TaxID=1033252 RepID=A0AAD7MUE1_9AGAR|nr:hypothetical protein B0H16DRAFT_1468069 [Mycena metata]
MTSLATLELNGIPLIWDTSCIFDHLVDVELCDFPPGVPIGCRVFSALFSAARCLRFLRVGNITVPESDIRSRTAMCSATLQKLDVRLDSTIGPLLQLMDFPNLKKLVVRAFDSADMACILPLKHHLRRVAVFKLHGWLGRGSLMWPLFDSLESISRVDFTHARRDAFTSFCGWTSSRILGELKSRTVKVDQLCVGHVSTAEIVAYCEVRMAQEMDRCALDLRLERPSVAREATPQTAAELDWLRGRVITPTYPRSQRNSHFCHVNDSARVVDDGFLLAMSPPRQDLIVFCENSIQSKARSLSIAATHIQCCPPALAPERVDQLLRNVRALQEAAPRCLAFDLWTNSPDTVASVMQLLVSASAASLEHLSLTCTAFAVPGSPSSIIYSAPACVFGGRLPFLKELNLFGVPLDWSNVASLPNLTRLSMRSIPPSGSPTFDQFAALVAFAPRLQSLVLEAVGCDAPPDAGSVTELASVTELEFSFGMGPYVESSRLYNLLGSLRLPNLRVLFASFVSQPSIHAFANSSLFARASNISFAGSVCCDGWLEALLSNLQSVRRLDLRCAAARFIPAISSPIRTSTGLVLPCPNLTTLIVRGGQWDVLRRFVKVRKEGGLPLEGIVYESAELSTESTIDRYHLADFFRIGKAVRSTIFAITCNISGPSCFFCYFHLHYVSSVCSRSKNKGGSILRDFYLKESENFDPFQLSQFAQAVFCGNYDIVKQAIDAGVSPDLNGTETPFLYGYATILVLGAQFLETLECLLSMGAPADLGDIVGCTVLHHSNTLMVPKEDLFRCIITHGADPSRKNRFGEVCLLGALHHGNLTMLSVLLDANVDFTLEDADGYSAWKHFPTCGSRVVAMVMKWDRTMAGSRAPYQEKACDLPLPAAQWAHHKMLCKPFSPANSAAVIPYLTFVPTPATMEGVVRVPMSNLYPEAAGGRGVAAVPMAKLPFDLAFGPKTLVIKV